MATGTTAQTELEAINMMLGAVFEAPVNTLEPAGIEDVAIARRDLANEVRAILLRGVAGNIEKDVTLSVDVATGRIPLPANCLRVDSMPGDGSDVAQRGSYLYDRKNHTFTFTRAVKCEVYYHLEWVDLPEHIKHCAMVLAARKFQKTVLGSSDKGKYQATDETEARNILGEAEADIEDSNATTDNWSVYSILER